MVLNAKETQSFTKLHTMQEDRTNELLMSDIPYIKK